MTPDPPGKRVPRDHCAHAWFIWNLAVGSIPAGVKARLN